MNVQAACGRSDAETQEAAVPVYDIDQHDIGNQLAVVDYIEDIYTFYRKTEVSS
jgi:cyclin B